MTRASSRRRARVLLSMWLAVTAPLAVTPWVPAQADERRRSGADTARHPAPSGAAAPTPTDRHVTQPQRRSVPAVRVEPPTLLEEIDPAVRHYWSGKCVQQRARGWGHTGDCRHPAYSGGTYGAPQVIVVPRPHPVAPAPRRRGHVNMPPPGSGGRGQLR